MKCADDVVIVDVAGIYQGSGAKYNPITILVLDIVARKISPTPQKHQLQKVDASSTTL